MTGRLILTGDVNLMNVADATVPFRHVAAALHEAAYLDHCRRFALSEAA